MDNPQLYLTANSVQNKMNKDFLEEYSKYIKWSKNSDAEILDIGCATGDVSHDIVFPLVPKTIRRYLAVDINEKMIKTASEKYKDHPKIQFGILDIGKEIPEDMKSRFDHVLSFLCLHWIQDQRLVMKNIYELLKPGGNTLFIFVLDCYQVQENYERMSKDPKWKDWLSNFDEIAPPYRKEKNPAEVLRQNIESSGLVPEICKKVSYELQFPNEKEFKGFLESVNPFVKNMPEDIKEEYMAEYFKLAQEGNPTKDNSNPLLLHADFLMAYANKKA